MTPGANHLKRRRDKMWVAFPPRFEVAVSLHFENPHLVVAFLLTRRTRDNRSRSRTRDSRSRSRTRDSRSRSRTRNHRSRSRTRNHRSRSRTRNHRSRSRTRDNRTRSRTGDRTRSRTGDRTRSLAAWAKSVEPRAIAPTVISAVSSFHVGIESGEPDDDRRQRE
jgi:hypothetical protein